MSPWRGRRVGVEAVSVVRKRMVRAFILGPRFLRYDTGFLGGIRSYIEYANDYYTCYRLDSSIEVLMFPARESFQTLCIRIQLTAEAYLGTPFE